MYRDRFRWLLLLVLFPPIISATTPPTWSQASLELGTGFVYQGRLQDGGAPADGVYDFEVDLWDRRNGGVRLGTRTLLGQPVQGGIFQLDLDFGDLRDPQSSWLELRVRDAGSSTYEELAPRQEVRGAGAACQVDGDLAVSGGLSVGQSSAPVSVQMHVIGPENDGGAAAFKISAGEGLGVENMIFDGNEIDSFGPFGGYNLYLNSNTDGDVLLASGGGQVVAGADAQVVGDLQVDTNLTVDGISDLGITLVSGTGCASATTYFQQCPAGTLPLSGGCSSTSERLLASVPFLGGGSSNGWLCLYEGLVCNGANTSYAMCARVEITDDTD